MAVSRRSPLAVIFLTVFLDLLGFGMVIPILPLYASDLHASTIKIRLFLSASSLSGLNCVLAYFILQEPKPPSQRSHARTLTWAALVRTVSTPRLLALMLLFFIVTFGFANLEGTFSLYLKLRFDYDRREASYLFAYIGVIMIVVQGVLVRWLAPRVGERRLVVSGIFCMAVAFFPQYGAASLPVLLLSIGFTALGNG